MQCNDAALADADSVISVRNLSKSYRLFRHPGNRIKQFFSFGLKQYHQTFPAIDNISFNAKQGEIIGIIGRNGSGKSTLLQLICGILSPTSGTINIKGKISALLELGTGFNPEFTGKENVYFYGTLLGLSKTEIDRRFDSIISFAEIGDFIDQPVRIYSSGMFVRLAFAVAINVSQDILIVDEALAVGDIQFQKKCLDYIFKFRKSGGTVLFVTHSHEQLVHLCDRALLLDMGKLIADGPVSEVLSIYTKQLFQPRHIEDERPFNYNTHETRWGDGKAKISNISILQGQEKNPPYIRPGIEIELIAEVEFMDTVERPIFGLTIKSTEGSIIFNTNSQKLHTPSPAQSRGKKINIRFFFVPFLDSGEYLISLGVAGESDGEIIAHDRRYDVLSINVQAPRNAQGDLMLQQKLEITSNET